MTRDSAKNRAVAICCFAFLVIWSAAIEGTGPPAGNHSRGFQAALFG